MTVSENTNPKIQYEDTFIEGQELPIPFPYVEREDVKCLVNNELIEYNTDYTVFNQTLTLLHPYGKAAITLFRETPLDQQAEFPQNNRFNSAKLNASLDKICMQQQEQEEALVRALKPPISAVNFDGTLPTPEGSRALKINADASGFEMSEYDPDEAMIITREYKEAAEAAAEEAEIQKNQAAQLRNETSDLKEEVQTTYENNVLINQDVQAKYEDIQQEHIDAVTLIQNEGTTQVANIQATGQTEYNKIITTGIDYKASIDLDNLTPAGEKHFLNKTQISDCILEIPQRINLELNNGILTLKAGSIVTIPNGFEEDGVTPHFDYVEIEDDITYGANGYTYTGFVCYNLTAHRLYVDTATRNPEMTGNAFYYNKNINRIQFVGTAGQPEHIISLPFAVCNMHATQGVTSIVQTFNGTGYIDNVVWVDKGIKYLIPDGRNADGTLKNKEFTTDKVITRTFNQGFSGSYYLYFSGTTFSVSGSDVYDSKLNQNTYGATVGKMTLTSDVISNFQTKQPFRAVDYNDKSEISGWGMPSNKYIDLTLGASGTTYTAPANGYFYFSKASSAEAQYAIFTNGTDGIAGEIGDGAATSGYGVHILRPVAKGTTVKLTYTLAGVTKFFRFVYAEGSY